MIGTVAGWQRNSTCDKRGRTLVCPADEDQLMPSKQQWSALAELVDDHMYTHSSVNSKVWYNHSLKKGSLKQIRIQHPESSEPRTEEKSGTLRGSQAR